MNREPEGHKGPKGYHRWNYLRVTKPSGTEEVSSGPCH